MLPAVTDASNMAIFDALINSASPVKASHSLTLWETENCPEKKKALNKSVLFRVVPRPGLEPGTYGLTGKQARQNPI